MRGIFSTIALLALATAQYALSQGSTYGYSVDIPADPRSVAMGESFVALPANEAALMYNPAGMADLRGISLSWSVRNMNWAEVTDGWRDISASATVGTTFGVFGAQYNRKSLGTYPVTTAASPDGSGMEVSPYFHNFSIGFATRLTRALAVGVSAKYFDYVTQFAGSLPTGYSQSGSTPAYLFDGGLTYTFPLGSIARGARDSLTFGLSYQNAGTKWKSGISYTVNSVTYGLNDDIEVPQYFRLGFSFALGLVPGNGEGLTPVGVLVTGEFRSLQSSSSPAYLAARGSHFWGAGLEVALFEIVALRGGAEVSPFGDFEGDANKAAYRYGAGIKLPLRLVGADLPVAVSAAYTVVPVRQIPLYKVFGLNQEKSVSIFSFDLIYTGDL